MEGLGRMVAHLIRDPEMWGFVRGEYEINDKINMSYGMVLTERPDTHRLDRPSFTVSGLPDTTEIT